MSGVPTIERAVGDFLLAKRVDGLAVKTLAWYRSLLKGLATRYYGKPIGELGAREIRVYLASLKDKTARYQGAKQRREIPGGLTLESYRDHVRALQLFFKWCYLEYSLDLSRNPMLRVKVPARDRAVPKAIAPEDLRAIFNNADCHKES